MFIKVPPAARIWTEEIFGPVLSGGAMRVMRVIHNMQAQAAAAGMCVTAVLPLADGVGKKVHVARVRPWL